MVCGLLHAILDQLVWCEGKGDDADLSLPYAATGERDNSLHEHGIAQALAC